MIRLKRDNDEQIIASVLAGRHDRFSLLVERYLPVVRSIAYARLRSGADVDDVAQETFLEAYQQLDRLRERRKFGPWIAAIARNVSGRLLTQRVRDRECGATLRAQEITLPPDLASAEVLNAIRAQVESLDSELREVLMLHYFARKSSREIARIMELSDAAVRKRLQRAREAVGDRLLRRFEAEDLRAVYSPKDAVRRIVASALSAGTAWESASACVPAGVAASAGLLAAGGASKSLVGLLAILAACSGVLIWVNLEPAPPPAPEESRKWVSAPEFAVAEPVIMAELPGGDPAGVPVSGRVLGTDGAPIPDATVNGYFRRLDQQVVQFEAHSDETGAYRFYLDVPWGVVSVEAAKEGFVSADRVRGNVAKEGVSGLDCTLLREAVAEGVVVDGRGNRLADMPVAAHLYAGERYYPEVGAVTSGQGGFRLAGLLPGEHGLAVMEKEEFHESLETARVVLAEGEIKTGVRLVYDGPGLALAGRVADNTGKPVAGARFYTMSNRQTRSDEDGRFRMERLEEGIVSLDVSHEHYQTLSATAESGTEDLELVMQPLGAVSGVVLDAATKEPVEEYEIRAHPGQIGSLDRIGVFRMTAVLDPEGRFRLDGLKHESNTLVVRAEGYAMTLKMVTVPPGQPLEDLVVELAPGATLRGRVVAAGGNPVAWASVLLGSLLGRPEPSHWQWAVSDADGNFEIANLPMRRQKISAYHEDHGKGEVYVELPQSVGGPPFLIELNAGGIIRGTVRREDRPAPAVRVSAYVPGGTGGAFAQVQSAADGSYELKMVPAGPVSVVAWLNHSSFPMVGRSLVLPAVAVEGQTVYLDIDVSEGTGSIEGEVLVPGNEEVSAGARIIVSDGPARHKMLAQSKNGRFYAADVPAGTASVIVHVSVGEQVSGDSVRRTMFRTVETEVKSGETSHVTVTFSGGGVVEGNVFGVDAKEWCNVSALEGVVALPDASPGTMDSLQGAIRGNAGIDAAGRYRLEGLEAGTYTLLIQAKAGDGTEVGDDSEEARFATAVVTVAEGEAVAADFDLR